MLFSSGWIFSSVARHATFLLIFHYVYNDLFALPIITYNIITLNVLAYNIHFYYAKDMKQTLVFLKELKNYKLEPL